MLGMSYINFPYRKASDIKVFGLDADKNLTPIDMVDGAIKEPYSSTKR